MEGMSPPENETLFVLPLNLKQVKESEGSLAPVTESLRSGCSSGKCLSCYKVAAKYVQG